MSVSNPTLGHRKAGRPTRRSLAQIEEWRASIKVSLILKCLSDHILGERKLGVTQLQAAKILLAKAMPDLHAVDLNVSDEREVREMSTAELMFLASESATLVAGDEQQCNTESTRVRH